MTDRQVLMSTDTSLDFMTATAVDANVVAVPGRHESRALADLCPRCVTSVEPAGVIDSPRGRVAVYCCADDGQRWLTGWWSAAEARRLGMRTR
jgi:hypothetical protein